VTTVLVARAGAEPVLLGAIRLALGAVVMTVAARLVTGALTVAPADRWRGLGLGVCMATFQASYFTAVTMTGIVVTALIAICTAPILVAVLAWAILGERVRPAVRLAVGLGVVGTTLVVMGPGGAAAPGPRFLVGAGLALLAALAYSFSVVLAKQGLARTPPLSLAALAFAAGAVLLAPSVLVAEAPGRQIALGWPWMLYLGVMVTGGAYACYFTGLRSVPASTAAIVTLVEPLTATALGTLLFDERLGPAAVLGALLLLAAFTLVLRTSATPPAELARRHNTA
jgi:drug/metabolite transporter, DME family